MSILSEVSSARAREVGLRYSKSEVLRIATELNEITAALRHATQRNHEFHADSCDGCSLAAEWIDRANNTSTFS